MSLTSDDLAKIEQLVTSVVRSEVKDIVRAEAGVIVRTEVEMLRNEMNERFSEVEDSLSSKIDTLAHNVARRFDEQDDKMNEILNALGADLTEHEEQIENHERRIYRLEQKAA